MELNSKLAHRLDENPLEAKFLEVWGDRQYWDTLAYILADDPKYPYYPTDREKQVAATVIQWLGTPVGQHFLETALGIEFRNRLPEDRRYQPKDLEIDNSATFL